jgi:esterase/lipase
MLREVASTNVLAPTQTDHFEIKRGNSTIQKLPVGVAGLMSPWNGSPWFVCEKAASALAAGCTVVMKSSELSPLQSKILMECFEKAGLPDGVINMVNGRGEVVGGMVAQEVALKRPSILRRLVLVGTAPRGGDDVMHLEKPSLAKHLQNPALKGYVVLQKIFFAPTDSSQAAGAAFIERLMQRSEDREPVAGPEVAQAQMAAFREWEQVSGERFSDLKKIQHPTLVVNGVFDEMIPVQNSYWLSAHLPNAVLLTYPDSGHGALSQFHDSFTEPKTAN